MPDPRVAFGCIILALLILFFMQGCTAMVVLLSL